MEPSTSTSRAITVALTSPLAAMVRRCSIISMVPSTSPSMIRSSRLSICPLNTTLFPRTALAAGPCNAIDGAADIGAPYPLIQIPVLWLADSVLGSDRRHGCASLGHSHLSQSGSDLLLQAVTTVSYRATPCKRRPSRHRVIRLFGCSVLRFGLFGVLALSDWWLLLRGFAGQR